MRNATATYRFLQIIPEFLSTDTVQEEVDPTVGTVKLSCELKN